MLLHVNINAYKYKYLFVNHNACLNDLDSTIWTIIINIYIDYYYVWYRISVGVKCMHPT